MNKKRHAASAVADIIPNKKQKLAGQPIEESTFELRASDLQSLLAFSQSGGDETRNSIRKFRTFLENIEKNKGTEIASQQISTLYDYLDSVISQHNSSPTPLSDLLQTWSFAAHAGNKILLTAVTSVLSLLIKTISTDLKFRKLGTAICLALLSDDNVTILKQCLSVSRSQDQLLSAVHRLLTEVVSFDGGICAKQVYRQRNILFSRIDELLGTRTGSDENKKGPLTSSLRLNAVRFLLANLRVQETAAKNDILSDPKRIRALIQNINDDSASTIALTLHTLEVHVLADTALSRQAKGRLFSESTLVKLSGLYTNQELQDETGQGEKVCDIVHKFLLKACCTSNAGVLHTTDGWYRPRSEYEPVESHSDNVPRFPTHYVDKSTSEASIHVANNKLAGFIQELRPYANVHHRELVLSIFRAAPELVAAYFHGKRNFSFEPKLTSTWIGFSSFVLATTQLPIPTFQSSKGLPSVQIVLENVLPSSLTKKSLTRCFTQSSMLIRLLSAKLLTSASHRLYQILRSAKRSLAASSILDRWETDLLNGFAEKCPDLQSVIKALQACGENDCLLKESLLNVISAIASVHPKTMIQANFDVSLLLTDALSEDHFSPMHVQDLSIEHLLHAATLTELDWFRKPERLDFSPFTTALRIYVDDGGSHFERLLSAVLYENFALQDSTSRPAFDALVFSMQQSTQIDALWGFIDNCLRRFMQRPIKYESELEDLSSVDTSAIISLLTIVILEQWPHFIQSHFEEEVSAVACWIARWLNACEQLGEDEDILAVLRDRFTSVTPPSAVERTSQIQPVEFTEQATEPKTLSKTNGTIVQDSRSSDLVLIVDSFKERLAITEHGDSYPELHRWTKKSILDAIEDSDISALLFCVSAPELNIRRQALSQLRQLATTVESSDYSEKAQLYLVLMEVVETGMQKDLVDPFPSIVPALASSIVHVLHDPSHFMYPKVNKFLMQAPEWTIGKLPSYWMTKVMYSPPTNDVGDSYTKEVEWLLQILTQGLRTAQDVDLYRRCCVWEHVMAKDLNAIGKEGTRRRDKSVDLLWRTTMVEGGSDTLITRFGILGWLVCNASVGTRSELLEALKKQILATCNTERLSTWEGGHKLKSGGKSVE